MAQRCKLTDDLNIQTHNVTQTNTGHLIIKTPSYVCVSMYVSAICARDGCWPTMSQTVPFGDATAVSYKGCARSICEMNIAWPVTFGDTISVYIYGLQ